MLLLLAALILVPLAAWTWACRGPDARRFCPSSIWAAPYDEARMRELANEGARELEEMFARDASDMTGTNA